MKRHDSPPALRRALGAAACGAALVIATAAPSGATGSHGNGGSHGHGGSHGRSINSSKDLRAAVNSQGVMEHLRALQRIADRNGGNRASGTPGYDASKDYIVSKLRSAGYRPTVQTFDFPFYQELSQAVVERVAPSPKSYVDGTDFATMTYSGSGDVTAAVTPVRLVIPPPPVAGSTTSGCQAADFAGFTPGTIALIQRGTCDFGVKAANAQAAGAAAVVIMNEGQPGRTDALAGTLGAPVVTIPVVGTSYAVGAELATPGTTLRIRTETESEVRQTYNILAETRKGADDNVVMSGSHLDSVIEGPGINDNGSGSAALLEVAEQFAKVKNNKNTVRFAWWGAEELNLLGSEHYVADLRDNKPDQLADISLYLNFDMVGSPNFVRFVYDGDNSAFPVGPGAAEGPAGSGAIEKLFHSYFQAQRLPSAETAFSGRSDYGPFIAEGIPAGGLFTGAEGVKTPAQAALFGGTAGVAYDACYHAACDNIGNVSTRAIDQNSDAMAHAIYTYGVSTRDVNGKGRPIQPYGKIGPQNPVPASTSGSGGLDHEHGLVR